MATGCDRQLKPLPILVLFPVQNSRKNQTKTELVISNNSIRISLKILPKNRIFSSIVALTSIAKTVTELALALAQLRIGGEIVLEPITAIGQQAIDIGQLLNIRH